MLLKIAMTYSYGHVQAGTPITQTYSGRTPPILGKFGHVPPSPYYLLIKMLLYIAITHALKLIVEFLTFLRRPECNLKPWVLIQSQFYNTTFTWIAEGEVEGTHGPPSIWVSNEKFHRAEQHCCWKFFFKMYPSFIN